MNTLFTEIRESQQGPKNRIFLILNMKFFLKKEFPQKVDFQEGARDSRIQI
jgi:hypothetical protein